MLNPRIQITEENEELITNASSTLSYVITYIANYFLPARLPIINYGINLGIFAISSLGLKGLAYRYFRNNEEIERQHIATMDLGDTPHGRVMLNRLHQLRDALNKTLNCPTTLVNVDSHTPYGTHNKQSLSLDDINQYHRNDIYITKNNYGLVIKEYACYLKQSRDFLNPYTNTPLPAEDVNALMEHPYVKAVTQLWTVRAHRAVVQPAEPAPVVLNLEQHANPIREQQAQRRTERLARRATRNPY